MNAQPHLHLIQGGGAQAPGEMPPGGGAAEGTLGARVRPGTGRGGVELHLGGELDAAMAADFRHALDVGWALGSGTLVVDLRDLVFMDLTSVELLLNAQRRAAEDGGRLAIVVGGAALRVLERTGVLEVFEVIAEPLERTQP